MQVASRSPIAVTGQQPSLDFYLWLSNIWVL